MTAPSSIQLRATNGLVIEARFIAFGESFGPHGRYVNETSEHVVDFFRIRPYRGPLHVAALSASHIRGLGPDDRLTIGDADLHPFDVSRLQSWLDSPFSKGEELI